ncbi:lysogenic conversion protein [Escherichia coli]|uniref:hypothetical protein n=1 Tax=Escherichia TaxID=561 RepID=UPI0006B577D0|nr:MULTISPECIES: hypothetical protein [Escherichia]EES3112901.1 lysogenic conversion protein [Escherichia coli]EFB9347663.1 lysogenic conversion protein [Escherichia coli]EFH2206314.1 lysogenic conversion protein [Escherichia coli]EGB5686114.1 lysogenic conversion protein [Escherichia coli]EGM8251390.1 lysogenic conversion protein [Escherichia coli]
MFTKRRLKNINWEASSVILAMVLFAGNIFYTNHRDDISMEAERDSIRTMFAYEIANNHRALTFLDKTRNIGFDENSEHFVGEPFAINVKSLGGPRLQVALNQTDKVFKAYFSELSKLDKEDVTLLMDYYHEQSILLECVKSTLQKMKSNNDIKVDIDGYLLEEHFMNEFNLSNILLKRYSHLLSQHLKKPETKDLHN